MQASTRLTVGTFYGMQIEPGTFHQIPVLTNVDSPNPASEASSSGCLVNPPAPNPESQRALPPDSHGTPKPSAGSNSSCLIPGTDVFGGFV